MNLNSLLRRGVLAALALLGDPLVKTPISADAAAIGLHPENPHYFQWRGKPTILITSAEHYGAVLNLDFDYAKYLDTLARDGCNLTRIFTGGAYFEPEGAFKIARNTLTPARGRFVAPWARSDQPGAADGSNKHDLARWNDAYFARLRDFAAQASKRGIVIEVNFFCPFYKDDQWRLSPFNIANNVNALGGITRTNVYTLDKHAGLLPVQERMVRKFVEELRDFDNIYYEICNEPYFGGVTLDWQRRIADVIADAQKDHPNPKLISQNIANKTAKVRDPHPAVSILNFHYTYPPAAVSENYALNRVIGENETGFRGTAAEVYRVEAWDFIIAGGGLFNHLDYSFTVGHEDGTFAYPPTQPGGGGVEFRRQLRVLRDFINRFDFVKMKPADNLVRAGRNDDVSVRVLAEPGRQYAIYIHNSPMPRWKDKTKLNTGDFQVNLELDAPAAIYRAEWIEPATGKVLLAETKQCVGGPLALPSPRYTQDVALRLTAMTNPMIASAKDDGYRGIWFTLGQKSEFGDKYSGGLGTYTANHVPIAIYAKEVDKTFFVYGGARQGKRHLLAMASYYDHRRGVVPRPTIVHDKQGVDDPHDNPSLCIDGKGHLWVFVSGRARKRPGFIYRSTKPYSTDEFQQVGEREFTYPQPRWFEGQGFLFLFTKYTKGRELYFSTSPDGREWTPDRKFAGMGGHYQTSHRRGNRVITAFNMHPGGSAQKGGDADKRTNLYFLQTDDFGKTWRNVRGEPVELPLADANNPALARDYQAEQRLVYIHDLDLDGDGRPAILFITSADHKPGPGGYPRWWTVAHWLGNKWEFSQVTRANHNYSTGSLYIEPDGAWRIIGPTERGPQPISSGGNIAIWTSRDAGKTWSKERDVTRASAMNHNYVRRPVNAHPDFYAFWADGNPDTFSPSKLYFTNRAGERVWQLPYDMSADTAAPLPLSP